MLNNAHDGVEVIELLPVLLRTITGQGAAFDIRNYVGKVKVIGVTAAGTGTLPTLDMWLEESDSGAGGWSAVPGGAFPQFGVVADFAELGMIVNERKPFVRAATSIGGTIPAFICSVLLIGQRQYR